MGTMLFAVLHIVCFGFFIPGLIITIPLHLIYASSRRKEKSEQYSAEQVAAAIRHLKESGQ